MQIADERREMHDEAATFVQAIARGRRQRGVGVRRRHGRAEDERELREHRAVSEQRRRQRVASQKWRLGLRDGIDRMTRDIEAFRTQKTAAPWLMRLTGTAIEECVFCATNCVMLGPGLEKEKP